MEMRISKETFSSDWSLLKGKFVIELEKGKEYSYNFINNNIHFWMEKRIYFVSSQTIKIGKERKYFYLLNGFHSNCRALTQEEFINKWNGNEDKERYYRLMTSSELKQLFNYMVNNSM